mmetsp:Transcript_37531/g.105987  ORF Transcript_37531/g.105987 Transcript_37531/m.105987 type:complete len:187 (-) Transcript_37531:115-675(-)
MDADCQQPQVAQQQQQMALQQQQQPAMGGQAVAAAQPGAKAAAAQPGRPSADIPYVLVWTGQVSILNKQHGTPLPLFQGTAHVQGPPGMKVEWPSSMVANKFASQQQVRASLDQSGVSIPNTPKVVFVLRKILNEKTVEDLINQKFAVLVDISPNVLILPFNHKDKIHGLLVPSKPSGGAAAPPRQ